jgi:hypothetical protein
MRSIVSILAAGLVLVVAQRARAEVINVSPKDSFSKIESAKAGDEVVIAPGTYAFRVYITAKGTAAKPIIIRAQDPAKPPVWDMSNTLAEDAPGSYKGRDRGRGCWQLAGAEHVQISGIVFQGCHNGDHNAGGLRYYDGAKAITVKECTFRGNDNGLTGGSEASEMTVEHCEFAANGNLAASKPTHNVYIYGGGGGGSFALRYSYLHDPVQGQNLHVRAKTSSIDYNWIARGKTYDVDLMSDDTDPPLEGPTSQEMLFRGNIIVQGDPQNKSQVFAVSNDEDLDQLTLKVRIIYNTFVVAFPQSHIVHLDDSAGKKIAELSNNIISQGIPVELEGDSSVNGTNNFVPPGAAVNGLTGTIFGTAPFKNPGAKDFTLAPGSKAIGAAKQGIAGSPDREYFENETVTRQYRVRASAKDIGAFESTTTGAGVGPRDPAPPGGPGQPGDPGTSSQGPGAGDAGGNGGGTSGAATDDGCGCRLTRSTRLAPATLFIAAIGALVIRARRTRRSSKH